MASDSESVVASIYYQSLSNKCGSLNYAGVKSGVGIISLGAKHTVKQCRFYNARNYSFDLDTVGFGRFESKTSLSRNDFFAEDNVLIERVYYPEMEKFLRDLTGAECVMGLQHFVRSANANPAIIKNDIDVQKNVGPARYPHVDYTSYGPMRHFGNLAPSERFMKGRVAIYTVWRSVSDTHVVKNHHLAMIDARTVVAPDDYYRFVVTHHSVNTEFFFLNAQHSSRHKWYYYPNMSKDEVIVMKQYDSDRSKSGRFCFHSSFDDPTAPKDYPHRESIESRYIAFFPDYKPNTIPLFYCEPIPDNNFVEIATKRMLSWIENYRYIWPQKEKKTMVRMLKEKSMNECLKFMITERVKKNWDELGKANEKQIQQIIEQLLTKKEELEDMRAYFKKFESYDYGNKK